MRFLEKFKERAHTIPVWGITKVGPLTAVIFQAVMLAAFYQSSICAQSARHSASATTPDRATNASQNSQVSEASRLLQAGQFDEAENLIRKALVSSPRD